MKGKAVSVVMLTLLMIGTLSLIFDMGQASDELHDVAVTNVVLSRSVVGQDYSVEINITVENQGDSAETFNVTAYYSNETLTSEQWETFWSMGDVNRDGYIDDIDVDLCLAAVGSHPDDPSWNPDADLDQDGNVDPDDFAIIATGYGRDIWTYFDILGGSIQRQTVNDLSPGFSTTLVFTWNTAGVPYGSYSISAKATRVPGETATADNTYVDGEVHVGIPGDFDIDGDVDPDDFSVFAGAYGSCRGDPNYSPIVDINGDGCVDEDDFSPIAGNYGKTAI